MTNSGQLGQLGQLGAITDEGRKRRTEEEEKKIEKMKAALISNCQPTAVGTITVTYSGKYKLTHNVVDFMNLKQTN